MEVIFLLILVFYLMLTLLRTKDLLHPSSVIKLIWIMSLSGLIAFKNSWGVNLDNGTMIIFFIGFISFDVGFSLINKVRIKRYKKKNSNQASAKKLIIILIAEVVILLIVLKCSLDIVGSFSGITNFLVKLRHIMKHRVVNTTILEFGTRALEIIGEVAFIYLLNERQKDKKIKIFIILVSLISLVLSTGRFRFMAIFTVYFFLFFIYKFKTNKGNKLKFQIKIIKIASKGGLFFILFFNIMGYLFNKGKEDFLNNFAIYFSGGMVAFNSQWENLSEHSSYFGEFLLAPVYNLIDRVYKISGESEEIKNLTIYGNNNFATNVYTFYRQQIIDFGVIGIVLAMLFLGGMFAILRKKSLMENKLGFWTAVYAYFMFGLVISIFMDVFFANSSYNYFSIILFYILLKSGKRRGKCH